MTDFVVLLARQRTGTNALQSVLERHPEVSCTREIFHPDPEQHEHLDPGRNWWRFLQRRSPEQIVAALTERDGKERAFLDFLAGVRAATPQRRIVLDVKYNSTHHLDGPWRELPSEPAFFGLLDRHRAPVLQLRRRNHLRAYLSLLTANRTNTWMTTDPGAPRPAEPIEIPVGDLLHRLRRWEHEDELVARRFPEGERRLTLEYDELFPHVGGGASREQLSRLAAWMGIADDFGQTEPAYVRQSVRPLSDLVANLPEVERALAGSELAPLLDDEPPFR